MSYYLPPGNGCLKIDLTALQENYDKLTHFSENAECAPVLKANAYGLGLETIARTLSEKGASNFFVALPEEGEQLRKILPFSRIFILHGFTHGSAEWFVKRNLIPVINTLAQAFEWLQYCRLAKKGHPAALQLDTGMSRFGLAEKDLSHGWLKELPLCLVMSHLACADEPEHPANREQLAKFTNMTERFPGVPRSLSASSGLFLGDEFLFDMVRPGAALYGIAPRKGGLNPLSQVVSLTVPVWQIREVEAGAFVGYGYSGHVLHKTRLATVGIGYADGFLRALGGRGVLWFKGKALPIVGRVSMDSVSVDITALGENALKEGDYLTVLGPEQSVDDLAEKAGTIGYEILTALGSRYSRYYHGL